MSVVRERTNGRRLARRSWRRVALARELFPCAASEWWMVAVGRLKRINYRVAHVLVRVCVCLLNSYSRRCLFSVLCLRVCVESIIYLTARETEQSFKTSFAPRRTARGPSARCRWVVTLPRKMVFWASVSRGKSGTVFAVIERRHGETVRTMNVVSKNHFIRNEYAVQGSQTFRYEYSIDKTSMLGPDSWKIV